MSGRRTESTLSVGLGTDDRGVSEVVAFILVFAIILGSVGLLYSTAFGAMLDYQENERETNAVRAMDALTENFNDVVRRNGVNERYGELSLREGAVATADDGTTVTVTVTDDSGDETTLGTDPGGRFAGYGDGTAELGAFAYESDDGTIAYEGGGLVRGDETGSAVVREPRIRCNEERKSAVVSLVAISAEDRSIRTSTGLGVTMTVKNRSSAVYTGEEVDTVEISVDTEYEDAWNAVLSWDDTDLAATCGSDDGLDRLVVTIVEADIQY